MISCKIGIYTYLPVLRRSDMELFQQTDFPDQRQPCFPSSEDIGDSNCSQDNKKQRDQYKRPIFPDEVIREIMALCNEYKIEFELISKLIIEIEANKNYTNNSMLTKAFDRIINQGWLHFESIEKGLQNEN